MHSGEHRAETVAAALAAPGIGQAVQDLGEVDRLVEVGGVEGGDRIVVAVALERGDRG
ncbi:hypothetical protein [Streptomyces sp. NBC_00557]|uniref:hypothetical protein n=1 Tax=Streptomyces sp. NBC_00557 TaxID=2975776 RepID=UPI002E7FEB72|nr:hypothetical protein [Streptomyces sp. NBC_00557]WUC39434.1 hypothetical protein OG956_37115 [Streptomyces sp. NBC_00557]